MKLEEVEAIIAYVDLKVEEAEDTIVLHRTRFGLREEIIKTRKKLISMCEDA